MLNSCSDPLICTQEITAYLKKNYRASHLRCASGYRHNDIVVLILGSLNIIVHGILCNQSSHMLLSLDVLVNFGLHILTSKCGNEVPNVRRCN